VLAALLGVVSAAALPPFYLIPFLLIAVPGLLVLIDAAPSWRGAAWIGFWFGFGHHLVGLYWVTDAIMVEAARFWWLVPLAVPALSVMLAVFIAAACAVTRLAPPGWRRVVAFAGAWTLADLARQFVGTGFPWNPWGSVWAIPGELGNVFIQLAAWLGTPGLTMLTVLIAATPVLGRRAMAAGAVVIVLWAGFGVLRLQAAAGAAPGVAVVLAQGNVAEGQKWNRTLAVEIFNRYLTLTRQGVQEAKALPAPGGKPPAIVVVWPESASPFLLQGDPGARAAIAEAARPAAAALVGSVRFSSGGYPTGPGDKPRNALIALDPDGNVTGTYDKWHLVPFGEYQPSWMPLPVQVVPGGGFAFGSGPATLHLPSLPDVGPLICYEAIFPAQVIDRADRPAWMVNITNDAWFGNSTGPRQHLAEARLRAVEEGLPLMRAANTGISAGFDAFGRELGRLGIDQAGVLVLTLPGALPPTPFARWGLFIPGLMAVVALGLGFGLARRRAVDDLRIGTS
jgi:apolipoprotein N-acyltransferase